MRTFLRKKPETVGQSPGTLVYIGPDKHFPPTMSHITIASGEVQETCCDLLGGKPALEPGKNHLVSLMGLHEPDLVKKVGEWFGLTPLTLEDILDTGQRPKVEDLDSGDVFLVLKNVDYLTDEKVLREEQVSLVWGEDYVLVFQESDALLAEPIVQRLRKGKGHIRTSGTGYLVVALLDSIVDRATVALGRIAAEAEELESALTDQADEDTLFQIYRLKREILFLRNSLWPMRDLLGQLSAKEMGSLDEFAAAYLRDVEDHAAKVVDEVKTLHDLLTGMLELHISLAGMRMNRIIKYLTGIATIFIPLTFLAGLYGMNFKHMPELEWEYGYFLVLGFMALIGLGMAVFFARRKWF